MVDDVLTKVDIMSMRHSLEVRSPLLDYRMFDLALSIPPSIRVKNGKTKYLLRQLANNYLPQKVLIAPKKGFGIPFEQYFYQDNKYIPYVVDVFDNMAKSKWFNTDDLIKYVDAANINRALPKNIYRLFCLGVWMEKNGVIN